MPKITEYIFLLLTFIVGITIGLYSATDFNGNINKDTENRIARNVQDVVLERIQDEYNLVKISSTKNSGENIIKEQNNKETNKVENIISVSSNEETLSPNAELVIKKEFTLCGHSTLNEMKIPIEMVNYTEDEVLKKYSGWKIESFRKDKVVLCKKIEANCNEHYVLRIEDNKLKVFNELTKDKFNYVEEVNLDISLLPTIELAELEAGVKIYGKTELDNLLENYNS